VAEFYPEELVKRSHELWEAFKTWGSARTDLTALGGWAVYELVNPTLAHQSKDVDLLFHSQAALDDFRRRMPGWHLAWRRKGRTTFKDCHFKDDPERRIVVDVFTTDSSIGASLFSMQKGTNVKTATYQGFLPDLGFLLRDKIDTIPMRSGWDHPQAKRLKDLLDVRLLVYHNRKGRLATELRDLVPVEARKSAAEFTHALSNDHPEYREEIAQVQRWLRQT
jgi:hypothetical protein